MKISRFLLFAVTSTVFVLLYVYQQSEIFRIGYAIDKKHDAFQELLDKNTLLRYNVQKDASLIRIGNKLSECRDFQMPDTYRLVKVKYPVGNSNPGAQLPKKENIIARLFGVKSQAEAKTINR
ncbi:MAG: hypothetical protein ACM3IL_01105 [Deltaproteobacteria bacterium]